MKGRLLIWVLLSTTPALAGEHMIVAVCNVSQIPLKVIKSAKAEAAYVFQAVDVKIHWTDCGAEVAAPDARMRPDFIVRLQAGRHVKKAGPASLAAMGEAFMDAAGVGFMADTYSGAIHELTRLYPIAGSDQVLGCTMAHELGHLLIGPGHRPNGLMRATWGRNELLALSQRHLKFDKEERAAILRKLRSRAAGPDAAAGNEQRPE